MRWIKAKDLKLSVVFKKRLERFKKYFVSWKVNYTFAVPNFTGKEDF